MLPPLHGALDHVRGHHNAIHATCSAWTDQAFPSLRPGRRDAAFAAERTLHRAIEKCAASVVVEVVVLVLLLAATLLLLPLLLRDGPSAELVMEERELAWLRASSAGA